MFQKICEKVNVQTSHSEGIVCLTLHLLPDKPAQENNIFLQSGESCTI